MIQLLGKIPKDAFYLCCSGGIDSMAMYKLLCKYPNNKFEVLYFNHGTVHGNEAEEFLKKTITNTKLHVGRISREKLPKESLEEYWRNERYSFFNNFIGKKILCHHLDDVVEWWIFSSLTGVPSLIPYEREDYIRPLLLNSKDVLSHFLRNDPYISDESNFEECHARNIIRNSMMKDVLRINPGIRTTIRNKLLQKWKP